MLIDWFTVIAQLLNFIVLLWLMKRFLYKPVLRVIDQREKKIAAEVALATQEKTAAQASSEELKKKNEEFDSGRAQALNSMHADIDSDRKKEAAEIANEATLARQSWKKTLGDDKVSLTSEMKSRAQIEVLGICRKIISDLSSTSFEQQIVQVFLDRLRSLAPDRKAQLTDQFKKSNSVVTIGSSFVLPDQKKEDIHLALNIFLDNTLKLEFVLIPHILAGLQLTVGSQRLSWNIDDYFNTFGASLETVNIPSLAMSIIPGEKGTPVKPVPA